MTSPAAELESATRQAPHLPAQLAALVEEDLEELESPDEVAGERGPRAQSNAHLRRVVGERMQEARRINGFDQTEAAARLGYSNSTQVSLVEQGKRLPPHDVLIKAAKVYSVSVDYLLGESPEFDRDPKLASRFAVLRRVERLLRFNTETVAQCLLDACASPAGDELRVARFSTRANALCDAIERFKQLNSRLFDDARGGATLLRTSRDMRDSTAQLDRFLERSAYARAHALSRAGELTTARGRRSAGEFQTT
ncbi:MAG: helix-turn-helix protein [Ramlibacter sp.]|nr:helix-turn-helix protein [Ramlibacter sp.]